MELKSTRITCGLAVETITQSYHGDNQAGMAIHFEGTIDEVLEFEKEILKLARTKQLVSRFKE